MKKKPYSILPLLVALLATLAFVGCSAEGKKNRALKQAERDYAAGKYDEAEIDCKNVLKVESLNPQAIGLLGLIYAEQGRIGQSIPLLLKSRELQPDNLEIRLRCAQINLATGNFKDARTEANLVLDRRPTDPEVPLLLVATIAKPQDIAEVRSRLENLPTTAAKGAPVLTALAMIEMRQGKIKAGESLLQQALAADPKFATAHSALGTLYGLKNDKTKALQAFKLAADNSPSRSVRRVQYAQFLVKTGNTPAGKKYLEDLTKSTPDFLAPWTMLAELSLLEKNFKDCASYVEKTIGRDPQNLEGLIIRGRMHLEQGNTAKGVEEFERLLKIYPRAPQVLHQLGLAYLAANNPTQATNTLKQALVLAPNNGDAAFALASAYLRSGDPSGTISLLKPLVQQRPNLAPPRLLLADAYRAQKNYSDALAVYRQLEKDFPGNAQTSLMIGLAFLQQNQPTEARKALSEALTRSPGLTSALERLVALDIAENKLTEATQRVETELARNPNSAAVHVLAAKISITKSDTARAETELRKAIELQPESNEAYFFLAQLYLNSKQEQKALANLQSIVGRDPKDVPSWMLIALILEQQKNYPAAREAYEKLLGVKPNSIAALNNIACLYSDQFNELEKAFTAAQKARELEPQEPHISDTLAWILFKKGQYRWALGLLEESAPKLTDSPEVQYHLGMARYMLGLEEPARLALQAALDQNKEFTGSTEARQRLALLALDAKTSDNAARALVEKILANQPGDPIALARLAALQEYDGAIDQAIATHLKAAQANPSATAPLLNLARLYALNKNTPKALEMAKAARKLAPDDPIASRMLGRIAFQAGDHDWAATLLSEAAQKITDDPELLYEEALAYFSIGRTPDAENSLREALALGETKSFTQAEQAKQCIDMIELIKKPTAAGLDRVEQILKRNKDDAPALMALGALNEQSGNSTAAGAAYQKVLTQFPGLIPAKIRLAVIGSAKPDFDANAYALAQQARTTNPDDAELARAFGILAYRKGGEAARAISLLKQSAKIYVNDAELFYYLGMAQLQTKELTAGRESLQKSLDAGLTPALAAEARKALAAQK